MRAVQALGGGEDPLLHPSRRKLPAPLLPRQLPEVSLSLSFFLSFFLSCFLSCFLCCLCLLGFSVILPLLSFVPFLLLSYSLCYSRSLNLSFLLFLSISPTFCLVLSPSFSLNALTLSPFISCSALSSPSLFCPSNLHHFVSSFNRTFLLSSLLSSYSAYPVGYRRYWFLSVLYMELCFSLACNCIAH